LTKSYAAAARFRTPLEERLNALDGGRGSDGPEYRPFTDGAIVQVGIRGGRLYTYLIILTAGV